MKKVFFYIIGCFFIIIGTIFIISYLNLLDVGYKFSEYVYFIIRRPECLLTFLGIIIIFLNNLGGKK